MVAGIGAALNPALSGARGALTPPGRDLGLAIGEIEALRELDLVALPEALEIGAGGNLLSPAAFASGDHLRLPVPPVRARDGLALFSALGQALDRFAACSDQPTSASEHAVLAEARMMALLRGIHGLEQEIRDQLARRKKA
jgi:hypothetical protein